MNWKDILFWIFLILAVFFLLWNIFGNSPSEFITLLTIIFMLLLKVWSVSDRQIRADMRMKESFNKIGRDIELIKRGLKVK